MYINHLEHCLEQQNLKKCEQLLLVSFHHGLSCQHQPNHVIHHEPEEATYLGLCQKDILAMISIMNKVKIRIF